MNNYISAEVRNKIKKMANRGDSYYTIYNFINHEKGNQSIITIRSIREIITETPVELYKINLLGWSVRRNPSEILNDQERDALKKFCSFKINSTINVSGVMGYPDYIINVEASKMKKEIEEYHNASIIEDEISNMYYAGWTAEQIHSKYNNMSIDDIKYIISHKLRMRSKYDDYLNKYKLEKFIRFELKPGDEFILYKYEYNTNMSISIYGGNGMHKERRKAIVKKLYPYVVETDIGYYPYIDVYTADRVH